MVVFIRNSIVLFLFLKLGLEILMINRILLKEKFEEKFIWISFEILVLDLFNNIILSTFTNLCISFTVYSKT